MTTSHVTDSPMNQSLMGTRTGREQVNTFAFLIKTQAVKVNYIYP